MSIRSRWAWGVVAAFVVVGGILALRLNLPKPALGPEAGTGSPSRSLPSLAGTLGWSHGEAAPESLAGHVVVVAFLSLDLPLSLRAASTLEAWNDAYSRYGVRVLGVHVPAFAFAADSARSSRAVARLGLGFPVALDASLEVARAFGGVDTLPRVVVAGPDGRVAWDREGIDALPEAEEAIRELVLSARQDLRFPAGAPSPRGAPRGEHAAVHLGRRVTGTLGRGPQDGQPPSPLSLYQVSRPYTPYPMGRWTPAADSCRTRQAENSWPCAMMPALGAVLSPPEEAPARVWIPE
jgi:hypothetical protein